MQPLIETLETRALFSAATLSTDAANLLAAVSSVRGDLRSAVTTYHTDAATLSTDVKALPKSKTNTVDVANVKKAQATAVAAESKDTAKLLAAVGTKLKQGLADYRAYSAKPTTANAQRLSKLITSTTTLATPYVTKLAADLGSSGTRIDVALNALVAANPGQTTLATNVQGAETDQATVSTQLQSGVTTIQQDLSIVANDLLGVQGA